MSPYEQEQFAFTGDSYEESASGASSAFLKEVYELQLDMLRATRPDFPAGSAADILARRLAELDTPRAPSSNSHGASSGEPGVGVIPVIRTAHPASRWPAAGSASDILAGELSLPIATPARDGNSHAPKQSLNDSSK